jgi:hypothetical protein
VEFGCDLRWNREIQRGQTWTETREKGLGRENDLHPVRRPRKMELYLHSPIDLHGLII